MNAVAGSKSIILDSNFLTDLTEDWRNGAYGDAEYAARCFLNWTINTYKNRAAARKKKSDPRPDPIHWQHQLTTLRGIDATLFIADILSRHNFFGIIPNASCALMRWVKGEWPLTLCQHIPAPKAVLRMQLEGTRPITVISDPERAEGPIMHKKNALEFLVHDLEHGYKFFHDPEQLRAQREFFCAISNILQSGLLRRHLQEEIFAERFDYLISDMNTHPAHSLQYLRAILVEHGLRQEHKGSRDPLTTEAQAEINHIVTSVSQAATV